MHNNRLLVFQCNQKDKIIEHFMNLLIQIVLAIPCFYVLCNFCFRYLTSSGGIGNKNNSSEIINKVFVFSLTCVLIFITGFRSRDGLSFDYGNYESIYYGFKDLSWKETISNGKGEILFSLLYKICGEITNYNIVPFMFIIAVATIIPIMKYFSNESCNPWISVLLLLTIGSFWTCFNTSRQYLAAAMYISTYKHIKEKNFFKYLLLVLLISFVHISTIVMLPFYWLLNIHWDFRRRAGKSLGLLCFITIGVLFSTRIIKSLVPPALFTVELMRDHNSPVQLIRPLSVLVLLFFNLRNMNFENRKDLFLFNSTFFYFVIFCMTLSFKIFQRWSYFVVFPTLIAVPNIISRIKSKDTRFFYYIIFMILPIAYAVGTLSKTTFTFFWD